MDYIKAPDVERKENRILRELEGLYERLNTDIPLVLKKKIRREINLLETMFNIITEQGYCTIEDLLNAGFILTY